MPITNNNVLLVALVVLASPLCQHVALSTAARKKSKFATLQFRLQDTLTKGVLVGINPLNASSFDKSPNFYGPLQLHCAQLQHNTPTDDDVEDNNEAGDDRIYRTVVNWTTPGWAPEGTEAALSIRSMTKAFVSAAVLELVAPVRPATEYDGPRVTLHLSLIHI